MSDKYDDAIEYLTEHPHEISFAWAHSQSHHAGCLFQFVTPDGLPFGWAKESRGLSCGCPVQIRGWDYVSTSEHLTDLIREDNRIPSDEESITVESLPAFAEIQRLADRTIRTK